MREIIRLSIPVILGYVGLMTMSLVDTIMVGRVSAAAIGAVGVGSSIFIAIMVFGIGILNGLDYLVSHAFGRKQLSEGFKSLVQSQIFTFLFSIPGTIALIALARNLEFFGLNPEIAREAGPYLEVLSYSLYPCFLYNGCRQYQQAQSDVRAAAIVMIAANVMNVFLNSWFIFGGPGVEAMGTVGSAYATLLSRLWMCSSMLVWLVIQDRRGERLISWQGLRYDRESMRELVKLGLPGALQLVLEIGAFSFVSMLAGRLSSPEAAAHQIALNIASITYMVSYGIGTAGSVVVAQGLGRGDPIQAVAQGWRSLGLGISLTAVFCALFLGLPDPILGLYTKDPEVLKVGKDLLFLAALFQLGDGTQAISTGVLRGVGETRGPMIANLLGHWFVGVPVGAWLCFSMGWRVQGLWVGFVLGLSVIAVALILAWRGRARKLLA